LVVQTVTNVSIKKGNYTWVPDNCRKDLVERFEKAIKSFSFTTVEPEIRTAAVAGTQPLASKLTLNAVAELKEGLTMEVALPKPFISLRIAPRRTLDAEQLTPTVELVLEEGGFQLQNCWTKDAEDGASPTTTEKNNPPSNSPHLPRAGGDMQRRRARQSSNPAANGACRSRARGFAASRTAEGGAFGGLTQSAMEDGHGVPWRVDMGLDEVC
jgi:hypothetical protein